MKYSHVAKPRICSGVFQTLCLAIAASWISILAEDANPTASKEIPALQAGDTIPVLTLTTMDNSSVELNALASKSPLVLIFYRGGWCPYCNRHLHALQGIEATLQDAGFKILAISPDTPDRLRDTADQQKLGYQLLSDSTASAAKGFGVAFRVDDVTIDKYKGYNIDLEAASGQDHHLLPHPAVFMTDKSGIIRFAHVQTDYRLRLDPEKILTEARKIQK